MFLPLLGSGVNNQFAGTITVGLFSSTYGYSSAGIGSITGDDDLLGHGREVINLSETSGTTTFIIRDTGGGMTALGQSGVWTQLFVNGIRIAPADASFFANGSDLLGEWRFTGDIFSLVANNGNTLGFSVV